MKYYLFAVMVFFISSCGSSGQEGDSSTSLGSASVNQFVVDESQILFRSDFESEQDSCWSSRPNSGGWNFNGCGGFVNIGQGDNVALAENEISHSGKKSLKVTFNRNEDYGGAEVEFPESERIFTRYYDYYTDSFDFGFGMKTHRIRSFNPSTQINNFDTIAVSWARSLNSNEFDMSGTNSTTRFISANYNGGPHNLSLIHI